MSLDYNRALQIVRDFCETPSDASEGAKSEYERGQVELIADLFGSELGGVDTEARSERIRRDLWGEDEGEETR